MAGIYIHIPFCKRACHYCDFHFSTSLRQKEELLVAINKEIALRQDYLQGAAVETIYFGGGTPSLLSRAEIDAVMETIHRHHRIASDAEITLEANPDDLDKKKLHELSQSPVNRLSIGIQSFFEEDLKWMNRAHNAVEAKMALEDSLSLGFENITVDLIYGYPLLSNEKWESNIQKALSFHIPHISAYSMTVEDRTALSHQIAKGKTAPMNEEQSAEQFLFLTDALGERGYEHYEISNFARDGHYARHNSNYWKGIPYLGIGPSAHSYNGHQRSWNIANNQQYIKAVNESKLPQETETLSPGDELNEYILITLRTMWGLDLSHVGERFGAGPSQQLRDKATPYLKSEHLRLTDNKLTLTRKGKLLADHITSALFC